MKLAKNFSAGFLNTAWAAVVSVLVVPFYLRYLGLEAYGLIGFFIALQAVIGLLDLGLSPTINREVARGRSTGDTATMQTLLGTLATVYWTTAVAILVLITLAAPVLGRSWLNGVNLGSDVVTHAVMLMGVIAACRWPVGFYLGAAMGAERIVTASAISIVTVTLGNIGAVLVLAFVSPTIQAFFLWQALIAVVHVGLMRHVTRDIFGSTGFAFDLDALRGIWRFTLGMGVVAILGAILMQLDKILLSKVVSLSDLGRYTLAGLVSRLLYLFLTPAFGAVYPRLSAMVAEKRIGDVEALYRIGTRALMTMIFPLSVFIAVFAFDLVKLWTGDAALAQSVAPVIALLVLGTAMNGVMHFPYALQLAHGRSALPALINLILIVVFVPMVLVLTLKFGIIGAAAAWAILNTLYVVLGTWLTHRELLPGIGARWLAGDVGVPLVASLAVGGLGSIAVRQFSFGIFAELAAGILLAILAVGATVWLSPSAVSRSRSILLSV
jgi:O-antigen/teichoic acid export membrane protein